MSVASLLREPRIAPSLLSADFSRLGELVATIMDAGARVIHVDVMDGHFVPPITMGPIVVEGLAEQVHDAGGILDVHLMVEAPERQVEAFATAGSDQITIHQEATPHVHFALSAIRDAGCRAGLAICPGTPVEAVSPAAGVLDHVLCMTVNPGWSGQAFIEGSPERVARLRDLLADEVTIGVDGGIGADTAAACAEAGARLLVAGSKVFGADEPVTAYAELVSAAGAA